MFGLQVIKAFMCHVNTNEVQYVCMLIRASTVLFILKLAPRIWTSVNCILTFQLHFSNMIPNGMWSLSGDCFYQWFNAMPFLVWGEYRQFLEVRKGHIHYGETFINHKLHVYVHAHTHTTLMNNRVFIQIPCL